nr:MAG TPA: hypothetical protein [Caudoviricetes sp.]
MALCSSTRTPRPGSSPPSTPGTSRSSRTGRSIRLPAL